MNFTAVLAVLMTVLFASDSAAAESPATSPLTTVDSVDLRRYSGTWYEIARV